ncbi:MAG: hypothetical protein LAT63_03100 [Marinobacter sp.]|nr:hypothetical protein [Marinobacter sp.]
MTVKTEHSGAKNGGGYWGTRLEAKTRSRIARRKQSRNATQTGVQHYAEDQQGMLPAGVQGAVGQA